MTTTYGAGRITTIRGAVDYFAHAHTDGLALCTNLPAIPLQPGWDELDEDERCPVCTVLAAARGE